MLRILSGPVGTGKSLRVFAEMRAALHEAPLFLIVPEQYAADAEREVIDRLGIPGLGLTGVDVVTPSRLYLRVQDELQLQGLPALDARASGIALAGALQSVQGELGALRRSALQPGFLAPAVRFIAQARSAGISPMDMMQAAEAVGDEALRGRARDLATLYGAHRALVEGRFRDEEDVHRAFIEALPRASFLQGARVYVDRFDVISRAMAQWLAALSRASEVLVVIDACAGHPAYAPMAGMIERVSAAAREAGVEVHLAEHAAPLTRVRPALDHLAAHLLDLSPPRYFSPQEEVALQRAASPRQEADACAARIAALVRGGYRYRDIAVCCDLARYGPLIQHRFTRAGIPFFLDRKSSALAHPSARALLWALEAAVSGWAPEAMLSLLGSGACGLDAQEAQLLRLVAEEIDLRGHHWEMPLPQAFLEAEAAREKLMVRLQALRRRLSSADTARACALAAFSYLEDTDACARLAEESEALAARGALLPAQQARQMWDVLLACLDALVDVLGERPLSPRALPALLEAALSATEVGVIPPEPDQVLISPLERLKTPPIRALFVLGATEDSLPTPPPQALLTDEEMQLLHKALPRRGDALLLSRLRLLSLYARPSDKLIITSPVADESGKAMRPPALLAQFVRLFEGKMGGLLRLSAREGVLSQEDALALAAAAGYGGAGEDERDALAFVRADPVLSGRLTALQRPPEQSPERLPAALCRQLYGPSLSPSRLEKFSYCPWAHFARYALRPRYALTPCPSAFDMGNALHAAMQHGLERLQDADLAALTPDVTAAWAGQDLQDALSAWRERPTYSLGRMAFLRRKSVRTAGRAVYAAALQLRAGAFRPLAMELRFEGGGIEGVIDRVDAMDTAEGRYLRVIDYKSGHTGLRLQDVMLGVKLQLPLYVRAAQQKLEGLSCGLYYMSLKDTPPPRDRTGKNAQPTDALLRSFRLTGWTLQDAVAIAGQDREEAGAVNGVRRNKDGSLSKLAPLLAPGAWDGLLAMAGRVARQANDAIHAGVVAALPLQVGSDPPACENCTEPGCHHALLPGAARRRAQPVPNEEMRKVLEEEMGATEED